MFQYITKEIIKERGIQDSRNSLRSQVWGGRIYESDQLLHITRASAHKWQLRRWRNISIEGKKDSKMTIF